MGGRLRQAGALSLVVISNVAGLVAVNDDQVWQASSTDAAVWIAQGSARAVNQVVVLDRQPYSVLISDVAPSPMKLQEAA